MTPLTAGTRIDQYEVERLVGQGAMGAVYAAREVSRNRRVAIKVLHPGTDADLARRRRARLLREAQALARLSHPNVVGFVDLGDFEGRVYIATEWVEGETLLDWLRAERRPWRAILDAFLAAAEGLSAAHAEGIIHRDFKPENVLVGADGRVRVSDFGLARGDALEPGDGERLTRVGTAIGTPAYMAPEQYIDGPIDERADQFSFCVALYEALYGFRPFAGSSDRDIQLAVVRGEVREPPPGPVPRAVATALRRGLATDPHDRYGSIEALRQALIEATRGRRISRRILWAGATAAVLLAAGTWVLLRRPAAQPSADFAPSPPTPPHPNHHVPPQRVRNVRPGTRHP